jgi:ribosomal protein S18 acetylase RimI-like enzyme
MTVSTRIATPSDLEAVARLFDAYRQFYEQAPDLEAAREFVGERLRQQDSVVLLAENADATPVGFCQLYPSFCSIEAKPIYILSDLFVAPCARRTGAGRALLVGAELHAAQTGRVKLELTTARTNKAAQAAYESLGWQLDEVYLGYGKRVEAQPDLKSTQP